ncbi:Phasin (PHA-granule associated protein) [Paraburkholderia steynii]|uniref:Phasin (PHA-granule associated protein) n=1 Tax=Paraburkholderia steynii TaxID=1245441 RepID=A0A4R0X836_9BURK|nr:Phasin (PHA-granule associated protein) [Paraburkholderia steynii]
MLTPEQVAATRQANLDLLFGLSNKIVEGVEKLAELNIQITRATLRDTFDGAQKMLSVKEPQECLALQDSLAAPTAEKMQAYGRQLFDIALATQAEFAKAAKTQCEAYGRQVQSAVDEVAKNAPAGSEAAVAALDSAIKAANTLVESVQKTSQQAVEVARSNLDIAAAEATKNTKRAIESVSPAAKR